MAIFTRNTRRSLAVVRPIMRRRPSMIPGPNRELRSQNRNPGKFSDETHALKPNKASLEREVRDRDMTIDLLMDTVLDA